MASAQEDSSERVRGIEPPLSAWEAEVLPLNYTRREPKANKTTGLNPKRPGSHRDSQEDVSLAHCRTSHCAERGVFRTDLHCADRVVGLVDEADHHPRWSVNRPDSH